MEKNKKKMKLSNMIPYGPDEIFLTEFVVKPLFYNKIKYYILVALQTKRIWKIFKYNNYYFNDNKLNSK